MDRIITSPVPLCIACGGVRFLKRIKRRGWQVEGSDFDEQATKKVTSRYGIKTHVGDLMQCAVPADSFDVITMSQTIEHLHDSATTLRECLRILNPGGLLHAGCRISIGVGASLVYHFQCKSTGKVKKNKGTNNSCINGASASRCSTATICGAGKSPPALYCPNRKTRGSSAGKYCAAI